MNRSTAYRTLIFSLAVLAISEPAKPYGEAGPQFLEICPSAQANGMGESLVAVPGAGLTFFNPAALGIYTLDNVGALGWSKADWFPTQGLNDFWIEQFYVNLGYSLQWLNSPGPYNLSLGVQYRNHLINYGETEMRDENNMLVGIVHSWERNRAIVLGAGFEYGVEIGAGVSLGRVYSHLGTSARQSIYDYGLMIRAPMVQILKKFDLYKPNASNPITFELAPSFGIARLNEGDGLTYEVTTGGSTQPPQTNSFWAPYPTLTRRGFAVDFTMNYRSLALLRTLWSTSWTYHHKEKGNFGENIVDRGWGVEFTLLGVFTYRIGEYSSPGGTDRNTEGFTIQTLGLTTIFSDYYVARQSNSYPLLSYLLTHASFKYHQSIWDTANPYLRDTRWVEFEIQF